MTNPVEHTLRRVKNFAGGADLDGIRRLAADLSIHGATNTRRQRSDALLRRLADAGVRVDVTALVDRVLTAIDGGPPSYMSVFAGRFVECGTDRVPLMRRGLARLDSALGAE